MRWPTRVFGYTLVLAGTTRGLAVTLRRGTDPQDPPPAVTIATGRLWQFAAGMVWRSHGRDQSVSPDLLRLSSRDCHQALRSFEQFFDSPPM